jgi:hypothetical protein
MSRNSNALIFLLNLTWGIVQSFLGFLLFFFFLKKPHSWYKGSIVTEIGKFKGLSLGVFVFVDSKDSEILQHEYGHCLHSALLGPFYLLVVGIPSLIWNKCFRTWRKKRNKAYSWFYTEAWADKWGGLPN